MVNQKYTVQVHDEYVMPGNTAVLKCQVINCVNRMMQIQPIRRTRNRENCMIIALQVPSYMSDFVMVTAWVQDTGMHLYPNTDIGGKYTVLSNGELYINNASPSDAFKTYTCRTVNKLTGELPWVVQLQFKCISDKF